jgi:uncharacterized membrane protein YtjA (UPF0391 family)
MNQAGASVRAIRRRNGAQIAGSNFTQTLPGSAMLSWTLAFFILAMVAAFFGFSGIAAGASQIAWILFVLFLVLFAVSLIRGRGPRV